MYKKSDYNSSPNKLPGNMNNDNKDVSSTKLSKYHYTNNIRIRSSSRTSGKKFSMYKPQSMGSYKAQNR